MQNVSVVIILCLAGAIAIISTQQKFDIFKPLPQPLMGEAAQVPTDYVMYQ